MVLSPTLSETQAPLHHCSAILGLLPVGLKVAAGASAVGDDEAMAPTKHLQEIS